MSRYTLRGYVDGVLVMEDTNLPISQVADLMHCMPCADDYVCDECAVQCVTDRFLTDLLVDGEAVVEERAGIIRMKSVAFREVPAATQEMDCA